MYAKKIKTILTIVALLCLSSGGCKKIQEIPGILLLPPGADQPAVIASNPSPMVPTLAPDASLYVEFSHEMDRESVRQAFALTGSGAAEGKPRWVGRRMYFDLSEDLNPGGSYVLNVGGSAMSESGARMNVDYIVHFIVGSRIDAPEINAISPADNAQSVGTATNIIINFSRPMDRQSVEAALRVSPAVTGAFSWNGSGTQVTFDPYNDFAFATSYSVSISRSAKDMEGINIPATFNSSFQVGSDFTSPAVSAIYEVGNPTALADNSTGIYKDSAFRVDFDEPMDFTATENNVVLKEVTGGQTIGGQYSWNASFDSLTFTPSQALAPENRYRLEVRTGAKDTSGNNVDSALLLNFTVDNSNGASNSNYLRIVALDKTVPTPTVSIDITPLALTGLVISGISDSISTTMQLKVEFDHGLQFGSLPENLDIRRVLGHHPGGGSVTSIQLASANGLTNNVMIVNLESIGDNEYELAFRGGRNGMLSATETGESGTWMNEDLILYLDIDRP